MQYTSNINNISTFVAFFNTLVEVGFSAVVYPCTREDKILFKFNCLL